MVFARRLTQRLVIKTVRFEPRVDIIAIHSGADSRFFDCARETGARGIVIQGTGRGNATPDALPGIQRALDAGVTVVMASRCPHGRVLDTYAYEASGHDLRRRGVILAGRMNAAKARIRLMLVLGRTSDPAEIRALMESGEYV